MTQRMHSKGRPYAGVPFSFGGFDQNPMGTVRSVFWVEVNELALMFR